MGVRVPIRFILSKNRKFICFAIAAAITILPMFTFFSSVGVVEAATTIDQDKSNIKKKESEISSIKNKLAQLDKDITNLKKQQNTQAQLKELYDKQIGLIEEQIEVTNSQIEELAAKISDAETEINELEAKYTASYKLFLELIRFYHEKGSITYLDMIVKSENLSDFLTRADNISEMLEYSKNVMADLKQKKQEVESKKNFQYDLIAEKTKYASEIEDRKQDAEKAKQDAEKSLKDLANNLTAAEKAQKREKELMDETQSEISKIMKDMQSKVNAQKEYTGGAMLWPVSPSYKKISSYYGPRTHPISKKPDSHTGIDIPAGYGTSVFAVSDGTVIISKYNGSYGNYVVIEHGGGVTTLYAHNSKNLVSAGQKVKRGDVIARIGSTGSSTGNHCHLEVSVNGVRKNPLNYVSVPK